MQGSSCALGGVGRSSTSHSCSGTDFQHAAHKIFLVLISYPILWSLTAKWQKENDHRIFFICDIVLVVVVEVEGCVCVFNEPVLKRALLLTFNLLVPSHMTTSIARKVGN